MSKVIKGKAPAKVTIELEGIVGTFEIPNGAAKVKFFSTFASNRVSNSMQFELLKELKPMRERSEVSDLENLEVLFQRDLNDSRIAKGLVPYLSGSLNRLAFFPAILGVLIPKEFLTKKNSKYPKKRVTKEDDIQFEEYWKFSPYKLEDDGKGSSSSLGLLTIDPTKARVLVIDGQHRANAFRYVTNTFLNDGSGQSENDVYRAFYDGVTIPENFKSDLPITLIWFESNENINPTEISRKLFVDVNNTARKVNVSRNILLDDFDIPSLLTRFYLSKVVSINKFSRNTFSLLHSGFDIDSDAYKAKDSVVVITSPQKIKEMMSWFFLGLNVPKEKYTAGKSVFMQITEFNERIPSIDIVKVDNAKRMQLKNSSDRSLFEDEFNKEYIEIFWEIFSELNLYKCHFKVCDIVDKWSYTQTDAIKVAWNKIICGGEGLYYTYNEEELSKTGKLSDGFTKYTSAIKEIEKRFNDQKLAIFSTKAHTLTIDDVSKLYSAFTSIAFQVGLVMAFRDYESIHNGSKKPAYLIKEFISLLNEFTLDNWFYILTELKAQLLNHGEMSPKAWPVYQKIFLKMIEAKERDFRYFDTKDTSATIESRISNFYAIRRVKSIIDSGLIQYGANGSPIIDDTQEKLIAEDAFQFTDSLMKKCGLKVIKASKLKEKCEIATRSAIASNSSDVDNDEDNDD